LRSPRFLHAAFGILLFLSIPITATAAPAAPGAPATKPTPPPERGRELIGADGLTLTDKQNKFSVRLPAADWKVYRETELGPFFLNIANPAGELRVEIQIKTYPIPLDMLQMTLEREFKKRGATVQRSTLAERNGAKCWDFEGEDQQAPGGVQHFLSRMCEIDSGHKVSAGVALPVAQWTAEEKVLRELVESVRVVP
jgi:hypothetical protein